MTIEQARAAVTEASQHDSCDQGAERYEARAQRLVAQTRYDWEPGDWDRWRHGGWYVGNLTYPSGAVGCVSNNYTDKKWRIACDPRPFEQQPTFRNRRDAAIGERNLIAAAVENQRGVFA